MIYIAVLQRGWVSVGRREHDGAGWKLTNARTIRRWENNKGLAAAANDGPEGLTLEDRCDEEFSDLAVIKWIKCNQEAWGEHV